jgi:hypothetical protein
MEVLEQQKSVSMLHGAEAKWAAVVEDRLAPMPRRLVKARDILHQAAAPPGVHLVRDLNSPHDVPFDPEAVVDLAAGNVFRLVAACVTSKAVPCDAPPKLAFVVDDRWEVTVQPRQTGQTLRALLAVPDDVALFRDFESPRDERIDDHERVEFADGPVFVTRAAAPPRITIIVEGTPHEWSKRRITYAEVVTLFDPQYPQHPEITYSVKYKNGPAENPEGILAPGASVKVKDKMVFNVSSTGQS